MNAKTQWEELSEFSAIATELTKEHPDDFSHIDVEAIAAYACSKTMASTFEMMGQVEPEQFCNTARNYVRISKQHWLSMGKEQKCMFVRSALERIAHAIPGHIRP